MKPTNGQTAHNDYNNDVSSPACSKISKRVRDAEAFDNAKRPKVIELSQGLPASEKSHSNDQPVELVVPNVEVSDFFALSKDESMLYTPLSL